MKRSLALIALAACGAEPDAAQPEDAATGPLGARDAAIVQHVAVDATSAGVTVTLAPTEPHDLVVVAIAIDGGPSDVRVRGASAGGRWLSPDTHPAPSVCGRSVQLWSLRDVMAGLTTIDISLDGAASSHVVAFEIAGLGPYPFTSSQNYFSTSAIVPASPPLDATTTAQAGSIVFATLTTCGTAQGLGQPTPFVAEPLGPGMTLAHHLPEETAMVGPHWLFDGADWNQVTIDYR